MNKTILKSILIITCVVLSINVKSQDTLKILPINKSTNKVEYSEVVKVEGTASELYTRALMWINSFFKNAGDVTKVRDESNGIISGTHRIQLMNKLADTTKTIAGGLVQYDFKLEFKDGRYKYTINDFASKEMSKQPIEKWLNPKDPSFTSNTRFHLEQVDKFTKDLIASLKKGMQPKVIVKDDW